jgi:hypothetical protein
MDKTQQLIQQQDQLQNLTNLLGGNGQSDFMSQFNSIFQMLMVISILVSIAFILFFILHFIHKWRVESAILRMDKNLEKLVAAQVPVPVDETKESSFDKEEKEQN